MAPKGSGRSNHLVLSPKAKRLATRMLRPLNFITKGKAEEYLRSRKVRYGTLSILKRMKLANTESALLALPAELRDEIWKFAAPRFGASINFCKGYAELYQYSRLLLCCRQMKNEVQPFFDEVRAQLFHDTELELTVPPSGDSKAYLRDLFQYIKRLRDDDLADIKRLTLRSSHTDIEALPTCSFADGAWYCQWTPSFPAVPHSRWVIQHSMERWEEVRRIVHSVLGAVLTSGQDFNLLTMRFQGEAVVIGSGWSQELIRRLVTAARSERLSKERLELMLAFQYEFRDGSP